MGLGEHRLQGAQPLRVGVDEQCASGGQGPLVYEKKVVFFYIIGQSDITRIM